MHKPCNKSIVRLDKQRKYRYTKKGLFTDIYTGTRSSSKKRGHHTPAYPKKELIVWIKSQSNFERLYTAWEASNFHRHLKPSVDRLDNSKGYTFDNMQLTTWIYNITKG